MAGFALQGLKLGAENMPDAVFENIPVVGPKYFREEQKRKDRKNRDHGNSPSSSSSSDSEQGPKSRSSRRRDDYRRDRDQDRGNRDDRRDRDNRRAKSQDNRTSQRSRGAPDSSYGANSYFPPPPMNQGNAYVPRPYNPREYGADPGSRDDYYHQHPQERQPYVPPPPIPPQQSAASPRPSSTPEPSQGYSDDRRSSVADRYRPSAYDSGYGQLVPRRPSYDSRVDSDYRRPDHDTYYPPSPYTREPEEYDSGYRDNSRSRRRSGSRGRKSKDKFGDRSESSRPFTPERIKEEFTKHKKDLGAAALGAIAGGILGNEFSKKNSTMGIAVGAAIGGLGAGFLESKREDRPQRRKLDRRWSSGRMRDGNDGF